MARKSRTEYSILNILTGIGGYIINTILGFVCRMVFVRCLADDYLGINGLFTNILSMLSLAELGVGSAIVYALYKPLAQNDQKKIASLMQFYGKAYRIIGIVVAIFGICMLPFLNFVITEPPHIKENLYLIYIVYLFNTSSTYFFSYRSSLLTADQQNYLVVGINYIVTIVQSIFQMIFLLITKEYLSYLFIQTIGIFIYNVTISYVAKRKYPYIAANNIQPLDKKERHGLIKNVQALTVWKLSGLLVNNTDNIIITYFSGLATVGYSSNYTLFSTMLNTMLNLLFNGITASVGNHNATESKEKKLGLFNFINLANFWLFAWATIGIFVVSSDLVLLCYGSKYVLNQNIPFIIALNFYMVGMQNAVWMYKNTLGLFRQGRYLLILTAIINLVCSIWLGKIWGLFGILLATAISRVFTNTWYDPYAVFKYGFRESPWKYFLKYFRFLIILFISGGICWMICENIHFGLIVNILLKVIICSIISNGIFWFAFHKEPEFQHVENIIKKVKNRFLS